MKKEYTCPSFDVISIMVTNSIAFGGENIDEEFPSDGFLSGL